ncbi:unnamed protein product, partial [Adineta steineri]
MGTIKYNDGKYDEALIHYQKALTIYENYCSSRPQDMIVCLSNIIMTLDNSGKSEETLNYRQQILAIQEKHPKSYKDIVSSLINIGHTKSSQAKLDDAIDYYSQAIVLLKEFDPTDHIQIAILFFWIATIRNDQRSFDRTIECLEQCLKISESNCSLNVND